MTGHTATVRPVVLLDNYWWAATVDCACGCGVTEPWLLDPDHDGPVGPWTPPPHELEGELPWWVMERIEATP